MLIMSVQFICTCENCMVCMIVSQKITGTVDTRKADGIEMWSQSPNSILNDVSSQLRTSHAKTENTENTVGIH